MGELRLVWASRRLIISSQVEKRLFEDFSSILFMRDIKLGISSGFTLAILVIPEYKWADLQSSNVQGSGMYGYCRVANS